MGVVRDDLVRSGRYLEMSDADWEVELAGRKEVISNYMRNDEWASKIKKDVMILIIGHPAGRPYLTGTVETHKKLGYWITLAYDNFIHHTNGTNYDDLMPPKDVMEKVDSFMMGHYSYWGGVSYPFMWLLRIAAGFALNFKYVYVINGDCIIEKPEGFPKMLEELGDYDLLSSGPTLEREIGTAGILCKSEAFFKIAKHMVDHVVPFEEYEKSTQDFGNTEGRLAVACRDLGIKVKSVEPGYNEQLHIPGTGFWYNTIGFRHIHGELNYAHRYHGNPPPPEYFDARYISGNDLVAMKKFAETKSQASIEDWYCK
jgi:hypothetical protein